MRIAVIGVAMLAAASAAYAQDAVTWLGRAAAAARQLNYVGTIVYQHGSYVETSRLVHLYELGEEYDKLITLEGPAREVIRSHGEVRCYYPDVKLVRVEPRTLRNAFPSLSPQQQKALVDYYDFRKAETMRVAGLDTGIEAGTSRRAASGFVAARGANARTSRGRRFDRSGAAPRRPGT